MGRLYIVGIGPGGDDQLTGAAIDAIRDSEAVVGYRPFLAQIEHLLAGQAVHGFGMKQEMARARLAVELASAGGRVALVSSGDPGIYGMAGPALEVAADNGRPAFEVRIVPGVTAMTWAAAQLGAPLMHDLAVISLSDLLTPWEAIARRVEAAAAADFVIALYNPKSKKRTRQLDEAFEIIGRHRSPDTPVGVVKKGDPPTVVRSSLGGLDRADVDMNTIVIIGNSSTARAGDWLITPRGYKR